MRVIEHDFAGPTSVRMSLGPGQIIVKADATTTHPRITLRPAVEGDATAEQVIRDAEITETPHSVSVTLPQPVGNTISSGNVATIQSGGRIIHSFNGPLTMGRDVTISDHNGVTTITTGAVTAEIHVPEMSTVTARAFSGDITVTGRLDGVDADTRSGEISVENAATVDVDTGSGTVRLGIVDNVEASTGAGDITITKMRMGRLRTGAGDITVRMVEGCTRMRTGSGDIEVTTATSDIQVSAGSGDIEVTTVNGAHVPPSNASTGIGRVRIN